MRSHSHRQTLSFDASNLGVRCGEPQRRYIAIDLNLFLGLCSVEKFDQFSENAGSDFISPTYDDMARTPLRAIDNHCQPKLFGLSARYTVSVMAMFGFIISFGIKNNVSTAKTLRANLTGVRGCLVFLLT